MGVPDERITVGERADPGDWQEQAAQPGVLARLVGRVGGADVAALSADLDGELYTADGWLARYSRFGEPPETA